jgi:hypothetical protein
MAVHQEGTPAPKAAEVKKTEEVVRKIIIDQPGRKQVYHVGAEVTEQDGTLRVNLGDSE